MSLIKEDEAGRLLEWAFENVDKDVFAPSEVQKETFWKTKKRQDTYIVEYDFKTISEFEKLCDFVFEKQFDKKIQRILSVAIFKHSQDHELVQNETERAADKLPEHIYVF